MAAQQKPQPMTVHEVLSEARQALHVRIERHDIPTAEEYAAEEGHGRLNVEPVPNEPVDVLLQRTFRDLRQAIHELGEHSARLADLTTALLMQQNIPARVTDLEKNLTDLSYRVGV